MPVMHKRLPGQVLSPWNSVFARIAREITAIQMEAAHPRKQEIQFRRMVAVVDTVLPLFEAAWIEFFPAGELIPGVDQVRLRNLCERLEERYEWANCTLEVACMELIQMFAVERVECPKYSNMHFTYVEWWRRVKQAVETAGKFMDEVDDSDDWVRYVGNVDPAKYAEELVNGQSVP